MRTLAIVRTHDERDIPVAGIYTIDPSHTSVEFIARHLTITKVRGRFRDVSGIITIADEPEESHVEVDIGVASVDTGNEDRDQHLRSADFFDVENHQRMTFKSTAVEPTDSGTWHVIGDLTLRGITRPVRLQVDFDGASESPAADQRIAFSASAEIDRSDWDLTWNVGLETGGFVVGKRVLIELNVQAVAAV